MPTHIRVWTGSPSATFTDMANADKRGKMCRILHVSCYGGQQAEAWIRNTLPEMTGDKARATTSDGVVVNMSFDVAIECVQVAQNIIPGLNTTTDQIKSMEAPRPILKAERPKWRGRADNDGIWLADMTDRNNEPREITTRQTAGKAYSLAKKVWTEVQKAGTMEEASAILRGAGCRLRSYYAAD